MIIIALVPQNTPNPKARIAHLLRVAAVRVEAVRAVVVPVATKTVRARANIAPLPVHQRANQRGALPLIVDPVPQASRRIQRVARNPPPLRVATSQSQRAAVGDAPPVVVHPLRDTSTHDVTDQDLGAAADLQVMGRAVAALVAVVVVVVVVVKRHR